jgi:hypothetical protein
MDYEGDECLIWPFSRDDKGYAHAQVWGKVRKAYRAMCVLAHGEPPSPTHVASHSCGNGSGGCINPNHLRWMTNSENQIERYRVHGRRPEKYYGQKGKLTREQIKQIQDERGRTPISQLAKRHGVKRGAIDYWHKKAREGHRAVD